MQNRFFSYFQQVETSYLLLAIMSTLYVVFFATLSLSTLLSSQYVLFIGTLLLIAYSLLSTNSQRIGFILNSYLIFLISFFYLETLFITTDDLHMKIKMVIIVKLMIFYFPSMLLILQHLSRNMMTKSDGIYIFYALYLVALIPNNPLSLMEKSAYLFNTFFVILIIFFLLHKFQKIKLSPNLIFFIFLVTSVMGLYLMFDIGIGWNKNFFEAFYHNSPFDLVNNLPRTWFTAFLDYELFQRFNGILSDPIMYGFFASMMLIIAMKDQKSLRLFIPFILFFLFYSFSKGAIYLVFMTWFLYLVNVRFVYTKFLFWLLFILLLVGFNALVSLGKGSSADIHFIGLVSPFIHINEYSMWEMVFGHGFTSGGNIAKSLEIVTNDNWLVTGAESGIGMIFYQTGLIGLAFIIYFFYKSTINRSIFTKHFISVYFVLFFTQENLANMNYLVLFLFTIYVLESSKAIKEERHEK